MDQTRDKKQKSPGKILLVPSLRKGNGFGHLKRCSSLVKKYPETFHLYLSPDSAFDVLNIFPEIKNNIVKKLSSNYSYIISDQRQCPKKLFNELKKYGNLVALDEGSSFRNDFDYLIDTFDVLDSYCPANIRNLSFNDLPEKTRNFDSNIKKVLISFGGEDPAGLSKKTADFFQNGYKNTFEQVDLLLGPVNKDDFSKTSNINILSQIDNLKDNLHEYDLVITSYGLTAYEAIYAGLPVLLINPSSYHKKLSEIAGFCEAGTADINKKRLQKLLDNTELISEVSKKIKTDTKKDLGLFLKNLNIQKDKCPACLEENNPVIKRFVDKSFRKCKSCDLVYQERFDNRQPDYSNSYFFEDYKKQYGKTYLDDFQNIQEFSSSRLKTIKKLLNKGSLLDVGCAYGPFLKLAKEQLYETYGFEINKEASDYVNKNLNIKCFNGDFSSLNPKELIGTDSFDILTMWYVIEHFENLNKLLVKINNLLKTGGLFCFSTPNARGLSARFNKNSFYNSSPDDHYTILDPGSSKKILKKYGFKIKKIKSTGFHPERLKIFNVKKNGLFFRFLLLLSRIFKLGDTFEVYAKKERNYVDG